MRRADALAHQFSSPFSPFRQHPQAFFAVSQLQFWCTEQAPASYYCDSFKIPPIAADVSRWPFVRDWLGLQSANTLVEATRAANSSVAAVAAFYVAFAALAIAAPRFVSHTRR
jgi:hypothetical protein